MPRLTVSVSDEIADKIRAHAKVEGLSISAYLRKLMVERLDRKWPDGFKESHLGKWQGPPIEIEPLPAQERDFGDDWPEGYWEEIEAGSKGERFVVPGR